MKRFLVLIIGVLAVFCTAAQKPVAPKIPGTGPSVHAFIPKGYDTLEGGSAYGDLNKDGKVDAAIILRPDEEKGDMAIDEGPQRILLVLLNSGAGYNLAGTSDKVAMCKSCGGMYGDPFANISILKGVLTVSHYGGSAWRWSDDESFRYQNGNMYLIGSTKDYYWNVSDCNGNGVGDAGRKYKDTNWMTGEEEIIENDEDCKPVKHIKHKIKKRPLVKLEAYKNE